MAPFAGPSQRDVLALLRGRRPHTRLPITLGQHQPQAVVTCEGGQWALRPLVLDHAAAAAAAAAALARGDGWMPEMEWRYLTPGPPVHQASSATALADLLEAGPWPYGGTR